jgi:hypothetical protein
MENLFAQIGIGIISNQVSKLIGDFYNGVKNAYDFKKELDDIIRMNGINVSSEKIIEILAANGIIEIRDSSIYAGQSVVLGSSGLGHSSFGNNSELRTDKSSINAGNGCFIQTNGNAFIKMGEDGSISFCTGKNY